MTAFDQLLSIDVTCAVIARETTCALILGPDSRALVTLAAGVGMSHESRAQQRLNFGLPFFTAPYPLLVTQVITERNTVFDTPALFGWIEDNYVTEPRAEVTGMTPYGEQPVMFLRDFDMDRPVELWTRLTNPERWARVAGVAIADSAAPTGVQMLAPDEGALSALWHALPVDARDFADNLRLDLGRGALKAALRQRRKATDPGLMRHADAWRVIAHAVPVARVNPAGAGDGAELMRLLHTGPAAE
jgi:hypothetical protein